MSLRWCGKRSREACFLSPISRIEFLDERALKPYPNDSAIFDLIISLQRPSELSQGFFSQDNQKRLLGLETEGALLTRIDLCQCPMADNYCDSSNLRSQSLARSPYCVSDRLGH